MKHTNPSSRKRSSRAGLCLRLFSVVLCFAMVLSMSGCGEAKMSQKQVFAMDTVMTLTAYGKKAEDGLEAAEAVITSMDKMLDPQLSTSVTSSINNANGENVAVPGQVAKMISTAQLVYTQTGGALDLSIYPLVKLWGFIDSKYYIPTETEIAENLKKLCFDKLVLTSFPSSGSFAVSVPAGAEISFGSVAKGCAASNAIEAMRQSGVTSGIVSLGGNVQTLGLKPDGTNWNIAIQDPNNTASHLGVLSLGETAVVTSGSYQRFFEGLDSKTYHHIINPATGSPVANNLVSLTVICKDGTMADCLSTALFVLGENKAVSYWRSYGNTKDGGFEMIMVTKDNSIICTKGLMEKFTLSNDNYKLSFTE